MFTFLKIPGGTAAEATPNDISMDTTNSTRFFISAAAFGNIIALAGLGVAIFKKGKAQHNGNGDLN